jgi:hypothetical protein
MNALEKMRRDGIVRLPAMDRKQIKEFTGYLMPKVVYNAHVKAKATQLSRLEGALKMKEWPMLCHDMNDIVAAPYLFEIALSMMPFVKEYFGGEQPRLYSMNAFWTQEVPDAKEYPDTHWWHRDGDDRRQLALFLYGSDVLENNDGAHLYQRGTHLVGDHQLKNDDGSPRHYTEPPQSCLETILGEAGTMFMSDPGGLHMGLRPKGLDGAGKPSRMLAWARYGVSEVPVVYQFDRLTPAPKEVLGNRYPSDPAIREAIKLVVA